MGPAADRGSWVPIPPRRPPNLKLPLKAMRLKLTGSHWDEEVNVNSTRGGTRQRRAWGAGGGPVGSTCSPLACSRTWVACVEELGGMWGGGGEGGRGREGGGERGMERESEGWRARDGEGERGMERETDRPGPRS